MIDHADAASVWPPRGSAGVHVDAVLGLSMTATSVGLVLVEGHDADGATMDRDAFAVQDSAIHTMEQATAAVLRTEAMAATRGFRLHSIGVTWSEDSDAEASMLMESLSESGFDNVVPVRLPEATEALARGIADAIGYVTTAVCVIEPESVITLIVNTVDGAVQTVFNHSIFSDDALISWLSSVFTRADWQPEALVVVGSARGFESILTQLEESLSVPVFAPEEAQLALARGAALASAQNTDLPLNLLGDADGVGGWHRVARPPSVTPHRRRRPLSEVGPVAMLAVAVVTFVVSLSIAVSLQFSPRQESVPVAAVIAPKAPAAVETVPPAAPPPPVEISPVPVAEAIQSPPPESPPPVYETPPVADIPADIPYIDQGPASVVEFPSAAPVPVDPPLAAPAPPPYEAPPYVAPVPPKKPGILTRIKEKLRPGPG